MIKITTELVTNASRGEDESRVTLDSLSYTFLRAFPHLLEISRACCAHSPSYHAVGPITIFYQCVGYGSDQSERSVVVKYDGPKEELALLRRTQELYRHITSSVGLEHVREWSEVSTLNALRWLRCRGLAGQAAAMTALDMAQLENFEAALLEPDPQRLWKVIELAHAQGCSLKEAADALAKSPR